MIFDEYLESRLREWANWCIDIELGNEGWPKESPMSKVMVVGILTRSPGPRPPMSHPRAEEVSFWIARLGVTYPLYAQAIQDLYFNRHLPYKVIAHARRISVSTLKQRAHDGKVWLNGFLTEYEKEAM